MKLAELFVELGARDGGLNRALDGVHRHLLGVAETAGRVGSTVGIALGGAVAFGLYKAVKGASNLNETLSKVDQVFGPAAGKVKATADDMAATFGLPKREILDAAAAIGLVGKGAGQTQDQAAGLGSQMARLAADASSFYNVPLETALEKIRAGLVGESEPLRAFGVMLSEDAVKAEALRMGLAKTAKELNDSAKIQARASLIAKGLKDATGDLERTQSGAENQTRKFWGTLQNLSDTVGTALLPAFTKFLGLSNEVMADLAAGVGNAGGKFAEFTEAVSSALDTAGVVYRNFGAVAGLVWLDVTEGVDRAAAYVAHLGDAFSTVFDYILSNAVTFGGALFSAVTNPLQAAVDSVRGISSIIAKLMSGALPDENDFLAAMPQAFQQAIDKLPELKMPEFQFDASGFDAAREAIKDQIAEREGARLGGKAAGAANAARPGEAANTGASPGAAATKRDVFQGGLEEFSRQIQSGIFKDDSAKKTASGVGQLVAIQQQALGIAKAKAAPQPAVPVGPA